MKARLTVVAAFCACWLNGQQTAPQPEGPTIPKLADVNQDILNLVIHDQWDRGTDMFGGRTVRRADAPSGSQIQKNDEERQEAARKLVDAGKLQSGKDFFYAALIFQHSFEGPNLILAHALAATAAAKGEPSARWLTASSFDRYLRSLKQPQVFGTQFSQMGGEWSMEPYDRTALSDGVRALWCVVPLKAQEQILEDARSGRTLSSTGIPDCH